MLLSPFSYDSARKPVVYGVWQVVCPWRHVDRAEDRSACAVTRAHASPDQNAIQDLAIGDC